MNIYIYLDKSKSLDTLVYYLLVLNDTYINLNLIGSLFVHHLAPDLPSHLQDARDPYRTMVESFKQGILVVWDFGSFQELRLMLQCCWHSFSALNT